jgi:hypothetical protein
MGSSASTATVWLTVRYCCFEDYMGALQQVAGAHDFLGLRAVWHLVLFSVDIGGPLSLLHRTIDGCFHSHPSRNSIWA